MIQIQDIKSIFRRKPRSQITDLDLDRGFQSIFKINFRRFQENSKKKVVFTMEMTVLSETAEAQ